MEPLIAQLMGCILSIHPTDVQRAYDANQTFQIPFLPEASVLRALDNLAGEGEAAAYGDQMAAKVADRKDSSTDSLSEISREAY